MPRIPIPFIGGGLLSQASKRRAEKIAPPFQPDMEAAEASGEDSPAATEEVRSTREAEERTPLEAAADDWGPDTGFEHVTAAEAVEPAFSSSESPAEGAQVPDYLVGAGEERTEEIERVEGSGAAAPELPAGVNRQDLQYVLPELLTGESGKQIRDLIEKMKSETVERAIPRAFAAGYLAGRRRQED